jgi:hypothetical protein
MPHARADEWDPQDDTGATAPLIAVGGTTLAHGPHTLDAVDTNDWFRVELEAGMPCRLESSGLLDTRAFLYADAAGTVEVANDDQGGTNDNFNLVYLPMASGTYYLKVQEFLAGAGGSYTLRYGFYSADAWDPDDNTGTNATTLTMGEAAKIHGPHVLDEYDHYDWFRIHLSAGATYRFGSIGLVEGTDTYGELFIDPLSEFPVIYNDDLNDTNYHFQFDYFPPVTGDYYLKVRAYEPGDEAEYDLRYYIPANDSDADQLLDTWEVQYFGGLAAEPTNASDSDAYTDLEEYVAGSDPTDPASYFAVTNGPPGSFVVNWPSVADREYRVFWTDHLTNAFQPLGPVLEYPQSSYTDTVHDAEPSGFYKVEVQLK